MRIEICHAVREDADNGVYDTYGLQMGNERVDDISTRRDIVVGLCRKLVANQLSKVHLVDAVEDALLDF